MINWGNFDGFFSTGIPSIILYPSILITLCLVVFGLIFNKITNFKKYALWILLIEYLFIVVCSTIICRGVKSLEFDRLELVPLWTYNSIITNVKGVSVWDIVLNVVLFIPLGFLIKLLWTSISLKRIIFIAIGCSFLIEINQYIYEKGVAQFDDIMHNTIGAVIGWLIASLFVRK